MPATNLSSGADFSSASSLSPERQEAIERLDRLQQQYDLLQRRIARVEEGSEPLDGSSLSALHMRLDGLSQDLERQRRRASGQCCNCGGGCRG
ncbi:hypothetical protein SA496_02060 [Pseudomonas sp. JS3066]|jgi:hypothetical protein|uniref:hypothetical protein n=1 Tax=unclassified Pseudomonas TaxID=196821 RepID=UPI000EA92DAF|nr:MULTISPECIES: hypothetical protein [unclassified Pseudomonas]AYF88465.1 hypothetical protein D6Z43_15400 [Pseudomonas sp. DY-1]MDH4654290.1 hypothetical protein [Pseudomonas sp. BN606]MRK23672.1 hypothetical protein [Pseudomonas sp. JG-B]WVK93997.1 hypothetical protein SA496_02060 [Pseudomonas sp. JS3066]